MRSGLWFCLLCALVNVAGCGGHSGSSATTGPTSSPVPAVDHVALVVLESHSFNDVIGSSFMPYFNALASQHALAGNYFADAHPSLSDYFLLTTGQSGNQ